MLSRTPSHAAGALAAPTRTPREPAGDGDSWVWVDSSEVAACRSTCATAAPAAPAPSGRGTTLHDGLHRVLAALAPLPRAAALFRREARPEAHDRDALLAAVGVSSVARVPVAATPAGRAAFLDAHAPSARALAGLEALLLRALRTKDLSFAAYGAATLLTEGWGGPPLWQLSEEAARQVLRRARAALHPDKLEPALARALAGEAERREDLLGRARALRQIYDVLGDVVADPELMRQGQAWAGVRAADVSAFVRLHALGAWVEPALATLREAWWAGWSSPAGSFARALAGRGLRAGGMYALVGVAVGVQAWREGAARRGQLRAEAQSQLAGGIDATRREWWRWASAASDALCHGRLLGRDAAGARAEKSEPFDFAGELRRKEAIGAGRRASESAAETAGGAPAHAP